MPNIYYLNPPTNPFWDFVASMEDHPFFGASGHPPRQPAAEGTDNAQEQPRQTEEPNANTEPSEKAKGKQPYVEDPPEVDPSTVQPNATQPEEPRQMPFRGRGRHGCGSGDEEEGRRCRRGPGHRGRWARHVAPPFTFGPPGPHGPWGPWGPWSRPEGPWERPEGPPGPRGPPGAPFGARSPHHHHHHGPPHGPPHGAHHGGPRPHSPPHYRGHGHPGRRGFDLGQFLNNLGERLGIDLAGAAENLGIDNKYTAPRTNTEADFEPRSDIFETPSQYVIHLSLPGAKKEDVGVDWDGEHSILRFAGVVHRPGVDEEMLSQLVVNGRKRENGVFEKAIRLGTKREPASIDVGGITAKMTDGVLIVKVPRVEVEHKTREVPVTSSESPSPARNNEKDLLFDADEEMHDAAPPTQHTPVPAPTSQAEFANINQKLKEKEAEAEARDDRSETLGREEQLPKYHVEEPADEDESDWEKYGTDDEGEYVKINVD